MRFSFNIPADILHESGRRIWGQKGTALQDYRHRNPRLFLFQRKGSDGTASDKPESFRRRVTWAELAISIESFLHQ
jgi:hypothetical protein